MSTAALPAVLALNQRYLLDFPHEAARRLEAISGSDAAELLSEQPPHAVVRAWQLLAPDIAQTVLEGLPESLGLYVLAEAEPAASAAVLVRYKPEERERRLAKLDAQVARELRDLLKYPDDSAGRLMDPHVSPVRADLSIGEALVRLRTMKRRGLRELFVVDDNGRLTGRVEIQDLAVADENLPLREITQTLLAAAKDLDPREEVVELLERQPITELPVVNHSGRFVGVIRQAALMTAIEQETSVDIQTMGGVSRD